MNLKTPWSGIITTDPWIGFWQGDKCSRPPHERSTHENTYLSALRVEELLEFES